MVGVTCILTFAGHQLVPWTKSRDGEEGVAYRILQSSATHLQRRALLTRVQNAATEGKIPWVTVQHSQWVLDADAMKAALPEAAEYSWFTGLLAFEPEHETEEREAFGRQFFDEIVVAYITPTSIGGMTMPLPQGLPPEISDSITRFRKDHPDPRKTAFVMMRFGSTLAHNAIIGAIRACLNPLGIDAVRADDKQYHDDLFPNVLTCIYGSGFGIAVFERLESDEFNPNVSLEVGYLLALRKPVCLLRDQTLKTLHTDLVGKLYRSFDPQRPEQDITVQLTAWLKDKGLV